MLHNITGVCSEFQLFLPWRHTPKHQELEASGWAQTLVE